MTHWKAPWRAAVWAGAAVAVLWVALGDRLVTSLAYAVERGRAQAVGDELAALHADQPELAVVSRAFKLVSKLVRPGVVHIRVEGGSQSSVSEEDLEDWLRRHLKDQKGTDRNQAPQNGQPPADSEQEGELRDQVEHWLRQHRLPPGAASGIILDHDGYILTNNHVVGGRTDIRVVLQDEREYEAKLVGTDPKTDLAVVKIEAPDLHPLPLGDSDQVEVGDWVLAIGSPFGLQQTVTHGIVSATGRARVPGVDIEYQDFIQTDAAINPGNSGGPLLNLHGEVIGINTAIATHGDAVNAGIAFAIPASRAAKIAQQLRTSGTVTRGWLGISYTEVDAADVEIFGLREARGIFVERVLTDSPADAAGLQVEDVVVSVDGVAVAGTEQLKGLIADLVPTEVARFKVVRYGAELEILVRMGTQPENMRAARFAPATEARQVARLGLYVRTFRPLFVGRGMQAYKAVERGVVVLDYVPEAEHVPDIARQELIVGCNGKPVKSVHDLNVALDEASADQKVRLEILEPTGDRRIVSVARSRR